MEALATDWMVESVRVTFFPGETLVLDKLEGWLKVLLGDEPQQVQKSSFNFEAMGFYQGTFIALKWVPGRIDWNFQPQPGGGFPVIGKIDTILAKLDLIASGIKEMQGWPITNRVAASVVLVRMAENQVEANNILSKLLPNVSIDISNTHDFIYRANKPDISGIIPSVRINNIGLWQTSVVQRVSFQFEIPAGQPQGMMPSIQSPVQTLSDPVLICRAEIECNTDGKSNIMADLQTQIDLIHDFGERITRIAIHGDPRVDSSKD